MDEKTETPLRVGIVGAGHMGAVHARHWSAVPGARVVGFADARIKKAVDLSAMYPGAGVYASVEALIEAGVDAVSVCVPTDEHTAVVLSALKAGIPTMCEKPLALTIADCDAMIAARDASSTLLTVGHVVRFFPEFANAKRLVDNGAIGKPATARVRRGGGFPYSDTDWFADPKRSGGVIGDLMVHDIDWVQWCFGPIVRVYARSLTRQLGDKSLDHLDYALVTARHESGVISHLEGTWAEPAGFATGFEIAGDGGLLTHDSRRATPFVKSLRQSSTAEAGVTIPSSPLVPTEDPYYKEIFAFAKSIREGVPLLVTAEDARRTVVVALAADESARTGQSVEIGARHD